MDLESNTGPEVREVGKTLKLYDTHMKSLHQVAKKTTNEIIRETNKLKQKALKEREKELKSQTKNAAKAARRASIQDGEEGGEDAVGVQSWKVYQEHQEGSCSASGAPDIKWNMEAFNLADLTESWEPKADQCTVFRGSEEVFRLADFEKTLDLSSPGRHVLGLPDWGEMCGDPTMSGH